jgi:hypothetical protein
MSNANAHLGAVGIEGQDVLRGTTREINLKNAYEDDRNYQEGIHFN